MKLPQLLKNKLFVNFNKKIDNALKESIKTMGEKTFLRDACEYALLNGGKRFRPLIVLLISKSLNIEQINLVINILFPLFSMYN